MIGNKNEKLNPQTIEQLDPSADDADRRGSRIGAGKRGVEKGEVEEEWGNAIAAKMSKGDERG